MSTLPLLSHAQDISTEPVPAATATATKPARPISAPPPNFSKPISAGLSLATSPESVDTQEPQKNINSANRKSVGAQELQARLKENRKSVGAQELQARIKAARRSLPASHVLSEAARRQLEIPSDLIHPALRARSGVSPKFERSRSFKSKSREDLSIDAVIRRLSSEVSAEAAGSHLKIPGDAPPVPALPAFPPPATHRPRPYQSASRRSSMTTRRSPLSIVSSADDDPEDTSADTSARTSRRTSTSASSRTSKSDEGKDVDDDTHEMIRVVSTLAHKAGYVKRKHEPEAQPSSSLSPTVGRTKSQVKSRRSWQISRKSILCSV